MRFAVDENTSALIGRLQIGYGTQKARSISTCFLRIRKHRFSLHHLHYILYRFHAISAVNQVCILGFLHYVPMIHIIQ